MGEKVKITYMIQDYQKARIKVFIFFREVVTKKIEVNFLMKKYLPSCGEETKLQLPLSWFKSVISERLVFLNLVSFSSKIEKTIHPTEPL